MKILNSPAFVTGESWPGYLLRLAKANGFSGIKSIAQILKLTNYQLIASSPFTALSLLDVNCTTLKEINCAFAPPGCKYIELGTYGRSIHARICPKCLTEDAIPYCRSAWDLALQVYCSIHRCVLIDECPQCKCQLDYQRPSVESCACGFDLRLCKPVAASNLYATIRDIFELCETFSSSIGTFASSSVRECDALGVILRLLAQSRPAPPPGRQTAKVRTSQAFVRAVDLNALAGWFEDWPNGFVDNLIRSKKASALSRAVKLNSSSLKAGKFPKIHRAVMDADARWRRSPRPGKKTVDKNTLMQKSLLGVKDLMALTGRHYNDVIVWLRTGLLGPTIQQKDASGREVLKVPSVQVVRLISLVQQTTTFKDAAQTVGVEPIVLRILARQGRLPSLRMGKADFTARVRHQDVYAFASKMSSMATLSRPNGQQPVDFSSAVVKVMRRRKSLVGKFLDQLGSRSLPLRIFDKHSVYLDDSYIYRDDLLAWIARNA